MKIDTGHINYKPTASGRVVALCQCCGRRSQPVQPAEDGEPREWKLGRGWSCAPYPHTFKHRDGSEGSTWTCPPCNKRLRAGETLVLRDGTACRRIA